MRRLILFSCTLAALAPAWCAGLEPLSDAALSKVQGRDGMSFNLSNFAMQGDAQLRYYTPNDAASFSIGNLATSRSDDVSAPFQDPYRLDVLKSPNGGADIINLAFPQNAAGKEVWQVAYDFGVDANGKNVSTSILLKDLVYTGGGLQWSTPRTGDGLAFGYALRSDLGSLTIQPNGRDLPNEQMVLSGVHVGAVDAAGNPIAGPWRIADVTTQPGIFNSRTETDGSTRLHLGIDWPDANGAAIGRVAIDNLSFHSAASGANVTTDLGASRIGAIQIQYLDVKFRP